MPPKKRVRKKKIVEKTITKDYLLEIAGEEIVLNEGLPNHIYHMKCGTTDRDILISTIGMSVDKMTDGCELRGDKVFVPKGGAAIFSMQHPSPQK